VQTDRTIPNNKPGIKIHDHEKGTCVSVIKKEATNSISIKTLTTEIHHMWNVKVKVTPIIIGATGTISKSFRQYLSNIPGKHDIKELQKKAIFGTAHTHTAERADVKV
jgi:hypothetical protein